MERVSMKNVCVLKGVVNILLMLTHACNSMVFVCYGPRATILPQRQTQENISVEIYLGMSIALKKTLIFNTIS